MTRHCPLLRRLVHPLVHPLAVGFAQGGGKVRLVFGSFASFGQLGAFASARDLARAAARLAQAVLLALWLALGLLAATSGVAHAQGVELNSLEVERRDGELTVAYSARLTLSPAVEEALKRGIPMYFTAEAVLFRDRWYWTDQRVARVRRSWRVAYQPLTAAWRVSLGGLSQVYGSLGEALGPLSRVSGWRLAEASAIEPDERYNVEFTLRLDREQLPPPLQLDVGSDYRLGVERFVRLQ
jgi:hypothetical protein